MTGPATSNFIKTIYLFVLSYEVENKGRARYNLEKLYIFADSLEELIYF